MGRRFVAGVGILVVALVVPAGLMAEPDLVELLPHDVSVAVGQRAWVLEDASAQLTLEQVRERPFRPAGNATLRYGYTSSAYWLRVPLRGGTRDGAWLLELDYPHHDVVDVWTLDELGNAQHQRAGERFDFHQRPVVHRNLVFPLNIPEGVERELMVRVQSQSAMHLGMTLWQPVAFAERVQQENFGFGVYFGVILAAFVYNLLLFLVLRESIYLLFVLFISSWGLMEMSLYGLTYQFIWPGQPWWAKQSIPFFIGLCAVWAMAFTRRFLELRTHAPGHVPSVRLGTALGVVASVLALVSPYQVALRGAALVALYGPLTGTWAGVTCWRRGYLPARYFVTGVMVLVIGVVVFLMRAFLMLPQSVFTQFAPQMASGACMVFFTLALGDRIKTADEERSRAQREALAAQQQAREELELRVVERTRELAEKNQELATLNIRKDELVATVSHDFRSPLAIIRQNVQTMLRDLRHMDPEDLQQFLEAVARQETRLSAMCTNLLDLAKLRNKGVTLETIDVVKLAGGMVEAYAPRARGAGVQLMLHVEEGAPSRVRGDADRLGQVLQNLVDNALRFTPAGGEVRVTLRGALSDGKTRLQMEVADSGAGIPVEALPRLFEPFYQVSQANRSGQGSGLGLAIVRAVVEAHGGQVTVESTEGKGATFRVVLPADVTTT
ncbi:MAG: sensor histidine kinase [Myxococcota bacterium]